MKVTNVRRPSRTGEEVKLTRLNADEQARRVHDALSRRAYQLFEHRGCSGRHEIDDWRQAESELLVPCCCGDMTLNGSLWLGTDSSNFEEGTMEIWVAPRRITICGKPRMGGKYCVSKALSADRIFRVIDLPLDVDPSGVTTRFSGPSLEIVMRKAQANPAPAMAAVA